MPLGASFLEDVPLVEFMYLVFTGMLCGITVCDSGLSFCVARLSSGIISFFLLKKFFFGSLFKQIFKDFTVSIISLGSHHGINPKCSGLENVEAAANGCF